MLLKLVHLVAPDCGCDRSSPPKPRSRRWPLPWRWPGRILSGLRQRPPTSAGCTPPRPRWRTSRRRSGSPHEGWTGSGRRGRDHATPPRHRGQCPSRRIRSRRQRPRRGGRPRVDQLQGAGSGAGVAGTDPAGQPDRRRRHRPQPELCRGLGREDHRTHAATPDRRRGIAVRFLPLWTGEETTREDLCRPVIHWAGRAAGRVTTMLPCGLTTLEECRPGPLSQDRSHAGCPPPVPAGWFRRSSAPGRSRFFPRSGGEVSSRGSGAAGASGRLLARPAPEHKEEGCLRASRCS